MTNSPSPERLRQLLVYDHKSGAMFWRNRPDSMFNIVRGNEPATWNKRYAGKRAGHVKKGTGYHVVKIDGTVFQGHRVAWAIYYGAWPKNEIDHVNGQQADNRIANLRDVTASQNCRNRRMLKNNSSGVTGVRWLEREGRWAARITTNRKQVHLGSFVNKADAIAARKAAEDDLGFTERHGMPDD